MKQKQFGSLEIVITKRKLQVPTTPVKKRCQSQSIGKTSRSHGCLLLLAVPNDSQVQILMLLHSLNKMTLHVTQRLGRN